MEVEADVRIQDTRPSMLPLNDMALVSHCDDHSSRSASISGILPAIINLRKSMSVRTTKLSLAELIGLRCFVSSRLKPSICD